MTSIYDKCSRFDGLSTVTAPTANYDHYSTSLGNWRDTPVAVGGSYPDNKNVEHFEDGIWTIKADFPFVTDAISHYSMATLHDDLYLFGGSPTSEAGTLATRYDGTIWINIGSMMQERYGHRSVVKGNVIYHIGGSYTKLVTNKLNRN